jgi:uncharacterized membrane protein YbhN (UPF0104 family)
MHHLPRLIGFALMIAFAAWCALSLRADLARMSFGPVLHSWDVVLLAMLLSILNYVLRIVRWKWYLDRLGRSLTFGFAALTYVAGFAFTLSPGKVGEVARGYSIADALLITIVCRIVTLWLAVCLGWVAVVVLRHRPVAAVMPWR